MKEIWKHFVRCAVASTSSVKEARRAEGTTDSELEAFNNGNFYGVRTCALITGYSESYLFDTFCIVESIMDDYIKRGGDPYTTSSYMDEVFDRLNFMGFNGHEKKE